MSIVFVVATDWNLRTAVRAELREMGIEAIGMDSANDVDRMIASDGFPNVAVVEATSELLGDIRIYNLVQRVPSVLIASRTVAVSLPDNAAILHRPVRIADIVSMVNELLARSGTA